MIRINLLKPETREVREPSGPAGVPEVGPPKKPHLGSLIFLALIVGLGAFYYLQKRAFDNETALLEKARQEKQQLQYVTAKLEQLNAQKASLLRKIALIQDLKSRQDLAVRIMDDLSRRLPDWVWLTEATFDSATLQIRGKALSNNLIADFITNLEGSPNLKNINLNGSTTRRTDRDEYVEFSLTAAVTRTQEPPQAAAQPAAKKRGTA